MTDCSSNLDLTPLFSIVTFVISFYRVLYFVLYICSSLYYDIMLFALPEERASWLRKFEHLKYILAYFMHRCCNASALPGSPTPRFRFSLFFFLIFSPDFYTLVHCTQEVIGSRQLTPQLFPFFLFIFYFSFILLFPFSFSLFLSLFFTFIYPSYNVILPDAGCLPAQHHNF
jgi:hypothetical protein